MSRREDQIEEAAEAAEREAETLTVEACASRQVGGLTAAEWRERCERAERDLASERGKNGDIERRKAQRSARDAVISAANMEVRADAAEAARDEALAGLAGLRVLIEEDLIAVGCDEHGGRAKACTWCAKQREIVKRTDDALANTSTLATAYTKRVRAESLREAADDALRNTPEGGWKPSTCLVAGDDAHAVSQWLRELAKAPT